jgi:hypothetical protein
MTGRGLNEVGGTVMSVEQTAKPECLGRPGNLTVCHRSPTVGLKFGPCPIRLQGY